MFLVGLTGGIASGKTTVARRLVELGAHEIDADLVAREVVLPGTEGLESVVSAFGQQVLDDDKNLDRACLGEVIFSDESKRLELEAILHPLIQKRTRQLIQGMPSDSIVVYSVPLLVEASVDYPFDFIVTVEAGEEIQLERLMASRGLTLEQASNRIKSQATSSARIARSNLVIDSSKSKEELFEQVDALWKKLVLLAKS